MGKETLKNLLIAGGVFLLMLSVLPRLLPLPPQPQGTPGVTPMANGTGQAQPSGTSAGATPSGASGSSGNTLGNGFSVREADAPTTAILGAAEHDGVDRKNPGPYRMRLTVSSIGA